MCNSCYRTVEFVLPSLAVWLVIIVALPAASYILGSGNEWLDTIDLESLVFEGVTRPLLSQIE